MTNEQIKDLVDSLSPIKAKQILSDQVSHEVHETIKIALVVAAFHTGLSDD